MAKRPPTVTTGSVFAMRSPLLPLSRFTRWADGVTGDLDKDCELVRERMRELLTRADVRDAVFVASPDLYDSIQYWLENPNTQRGQRTERSLVRYISRMSSRATPFGLFSGVSTGAIADSTNLTLPPQSDYERHTRLDNDYLFALGEELRKLAELRQNMLYRPNSSLYDVQGRLRYAEARLIGRQRTHHLVAVELTEYLSATLDRAADGARRDDLAKALVDDDPDIELDEALAFVDELIDSQLLMSDLAPAVTGDEPIVGVLEKLEALGATEVHQRLAKAQQRIESIDADGLGVDSQRYREIAEGLSDFGVPVELNRLFQVDMVKKTPAATVSRRVVDEVVRAIDIFARITVTQSETRVSRFIEAFQSRYESSEVPLTVALDDEAGIGFADSNSLGADAAPLLAGLDFPGPPQRGMQVRWFARDNHLLELIERAKRSGTTSIELTKDDIKKLEQPARATLPDSFAVKPTLIAESAEAVNSGKFKIEVSGGFGPSGARLFGRFCHADQGHHDMVLETLRAEEALRPDAIFAEVTHLPDGRIGNILCRPVLRQYEIPYLGLSGADRDMQIPISDLMVSVRQGRVVLRSVRLNKEIIPRMSTAHNYSVFGLVLYRFLCSLQDQGLSGLSWSWGVFGDVPFLPRVTHGKFVFSKAQWKIAESELSPLAKSHKGVKSAKSPDAIAAIRGKAFAAAQALRESRGLPRFVLLADGDNELPVDFDNPLSVDSFVALVKNRPGIELVELYPGDDELVAEGPEGLYYHELAFPFTRVREPSPPTQFPDTSGVARRFSLGSSWLYTKFYCGTSSVDDVLIEVVAPAVRKAIEDGVIDKWFFIRYGDPDWHVRVRFHGDPDRMRNELLPLLETGAAPLISDGVIRKFQIDTYERELERYGGAAGIEPCEDWFWADSEAVLGTLELLEGDEGEDARWRMCFRGLDMLLDDLGFTLEQKRAVAGRVRDGFAAEFHSTTALKKALGTKYREHEAELMVFLNRDPAVDAEHDYSPAFPLYELRTERQRAVAARLRAAAEAGELTNSLEDLAASFMHMHANRLLRSVARAQEMVLYDMMKRSYDSLVARKRQREKHLAKAEESS